MQLNEEEIKKLRVFKKLKWIKIKRSFMRKGFGESMCKETKHNILKFFEEKLKL